MVIFKNQRKYYEYKYQTENEFEEDVKKNSSFFFGNKSIYIDAKKKIHSKLLGNTVPDGFLIDLADIENPEFYIVEVELFKHDFYSHIFPQITKFFAFFQNMKGRKDLVERIYTIVNEDKAIKKRFQNISNQQEVYKYISDMVENSQNILLIIDDEKKELPEIINTYTDTWGKIVKLQVIKKFVTKEEEIFTMEPEFEAVEFSLEKSAQEETNIELSENFHLEGKSDEVKAIYNKLKKEFININPDLKFNPQKYYISVINEKNVIYYKVRKKKIRLVIMMEEGLIRQKIKHHPVKSLSEGVKNYYNGECAVVDILSVNNLDEVVNLVTPLIQKKEIDEE